MRKQRLLAVLLAMAVALSGVKGFSVEASEAGLEEPAAEENGSLEEIPETVDKEAENLPESIEETAGNDEKEKKETEEQSELPDPDAVQEEKATEAAAEDVVLDETYTDDEKETEGLPEANEPVSQQENEGDNLPDTRAGEGETEADQASPWITNCYVSDISKESYTVNVSAEDDVAPTRAECTITVTDAFQNILTTKTVKADLTVDGTSGSASIIISRSSCENKEGNYTTEVQVFDAAENASSTEKLTDRIALYDADWYKNDSATDIFYYCNEDAGSQEYDYFMNFVIGRVMEFTSLSIGTDFQGYYEGMFSAGNREKYAALVRKYQNKLQAGELTLDDACMKLEEEMKTSGIVPAYEEIRNACPDLNEEQNSIGAYWWKLAAMLVEKPENEKAAFLSQVQAMSETFAKDQGAIDAYMEIYSETESYTWGQKAYGGLGLIPSQLKIAKEMQEARNRCYQAASKEEVQAIVQELNSKYSKEGETPLLGTAGSGGMEDMYAFKYTVGGKKIGALVYATSDPAVIRGELRHGGNEHFNAMVRDLAAYLKSPDQKNETYKNARTISIASSVANEENLCLEKATVEALKSYNLNLEFITGTIIYEFDAAKGLEARDYRLGYTGFYYVKDQNYQFLDTGFSVRIMSGGENGDFYFCHVDKDNTSVPCTGTPINFHDAQWSDELDDWVVDAVYATDPTYIDSTDDFYLLLPVSGGSVSMNLDVSGMTSELAAVMTPVIQMMAADSSKNTTVIQLEKEEGSLGEEGKTIDASVFSALQKANASASSKVGVDFRYEGVSYQFQDIDRPAQNMTLGVEETEVKTEYLSYGAPENTKITEIVTELDFAHSGELPGKAQVTIPVTAEEGTYGWYYVNSSTQKLEKASDENVTVADGKVVVPLEHCSSYVLVKADEVPETGGTKPGTQTGNNQSGTGTANEGGNSGSTSNGSDSNASTSNGGSSAADTVKAAKTGDSANITVWLLMLAVSAGAFGTGIYVSFKKKRA